MRSPFLPDSGKSSNSGGCYEVFWNVEVAGYQPERASVRFVRRLQQPWASALRLMNNPATIVFLYTVFGGVFLERVGRWREVLRPRGNCWNWRWGLSCKMCVSKSLCHPLQCSTPPRLARNSVRAMAKKTSLFWIVSSFLRLTSRCISV